jgi:hypothetical protein
LNRLLLRVVALHLSGQGRIDAGFLRKDISAIGGKGDRTECAR